MLLRTPVDGHSSTPDARRPAALLPTWPLTAMFGLFPLWWATGLLDIMWIPTAAAQALYLFRAGATRAPRGFGMWLLFLLWSGCSLVMVDNAADALGFA